MTPRKQPDPVWEGMSRVDFEAIKDYIGEIAEQIGLRDWDLILNTTPCEDPANRATCNPTYGQKRAMLTLCKDFATIADDDKRQVIIHELIHCHLDAIDTACRNVRNQLGEMVYPVWAESVKDAIEWATDGIASAIACRFPPFGVA